MIKKPGFTIMELLVVMFIVSIFSGMVIGLINSSFTKSNQLQSQSIVQTELNLAIDRLSRVLRSATEIVEATETSFKMLGFPNVSDTVASEINFYLDSGSINYTIIPPSGTAPNYTYDLADAEYRTLISKSTNSVSAPIFKYYDDQNSLLSYPVPTSLIRIVEPEIFALDANGVITDPLFVSTKITIRNLKTNL